MTEQEIELIRKQQDPEKVQTPEVLPDQKKVLVGQAVLSSILWGVDNFFFGLLKSRDLAVTCLMSTSFILIAIGYKTYQIKKLPHKSKREVIDVFFHKLYDFDTQKFNIGLIIYQLLYCIILGVLMLWLTTTASYYALQAQMNFGIVSSILCVTTILNTVFGYFFSNERLNLWQGVGMFLVISGICIISFSHNNSRAVEDQSEEQLHELNFNKIVAITLFLILSFLSATRNQIQKNICVNYHYNPYALTMDANLYFSIIMGVPTLIYYFSGHEEYTLYNFIVTFITGLIMVLFILVATNALVKGKMGPTSAILQTQSLYTITLTALILGRMPTTIQFISCIIQICGVVIIIINK